MSIKNASQFGKRYYGLHFSPGVAQYQDSEQEQPYNIFLNQNTINKMDSTFQGKPIFVNHRNEVTPKDLETADGYIVKSFFNQKDGMQWCEFLVTSDAGHEAINKGYQLSNAYVVKNSTHGGEWHAVPYSKEVTDAEYDHMALVPNPRYKESRIMTPEEFQKYNEEKSIELKRMTNSKEDKKSMFNFFKRSKFENADLDTMSVVLPKSGVEISLTKLINDADADMAKEKKAANHDHMVNINDKEMSVGDLVKAHCALMNEFESMKSETKKVDEKAPEVAEKESDKGEADKGKDESAKEKDKNADDAKGEHKDPDMDKKGPSDSKDKDPKVKAEHEVEEKADDKEDKKSNVDSAFKKMKHAEQSAVITPSEKRMNGVELGTKLYGSK